MQSLRDKSIVITGAGAGLGRAYALEVAAHGAAVVVNDVDAAAAGAVAAEIADAGGRATVHVGSVAGWDVAAELVSRAVAEFGRIDGLVNNAGVTVVRDAWDFSEADVRNVVDVNLLGTIFCGTHALRAMVQQRSGVIVNVVSGALIGILEHSLYGATKGAVASLTYGWAMDGAAHGVRVVGLSPLARTAMSLAWSNRDEAHMDEPPADTVAPLVVFLLGDGGADLSGQIVRLDAQGLSMLDPPAFSAPQPLDERTFAAVAEAFDASLRPDIHRVGLSQMDLREVQRVS